MIRKSKFWLTAAVVMSEDLDEVNMGDPSSIPLVKPKSSCLLIPERIKSMH